MLEKLSAKDFIDFDFLCKKYFWDSFMTDTSNTQENKGKDGVMSLKTDIAQQWNQKKNYLE